MANLKIEEIEGIGPAYGEKLRAAGCGNTDALLERGCTKAGRKQLGDTTGIAEKQLLKWVNMADMFRISGVGPEYAELLEASGVDTVRELAQRNAENLADKCAEVNARKALTRKVPTTAQVEDWIKQAAALGRRLEY